MYHKQAEATHSFEHYYYDIHHTAEKGLSDVTTSRALVLATAQARILIFTYLTSEQDNTYIDGSRASRCEAYWPFLEFISLSCYIVSSPR